MGKRVLVTCCTPYQLLVAAQVLATYYPQDQADLIVTDQMSGSRKIWEAAKGCGGFGRVYYLEEKRLNALSDNEAQKAAAKEISSAEMRARQLILKQKRQCLDDIIDEAENYLCSLSGQEYEDTIFKMLKNSEYGQGCEVILSKRDKEAMEEKLKDMGYNVSGETRDIEGGFVVKKGDIEYNYSFKSMIMVQREEISYLASEILFP